MSVVGPFRRTQGRPPRKPSAVGAAERTLFRDLPEGTRLGDYTVEQIHGLTGGAIPVMLSARGGARFQVDVMRRDGSAEAPAAVADTRWLSLYVANGGGGQTQTREDHGEAAIAMAAVLARREGEQPPVRGLLTLRERHAHFGDGFFAALA